MMNLSERLSLAVHWSQQCGEVAEIELDPNEAEYEDVKKKLKGRPLSNLTKITRVQNPYLYHRYMLRKLEYESLNVDIQEIHLLHATSKSKVQPIIEDNLDWRKSRRVKFGRGVSFARSAAYANKECCKTNGPYRAIIVAKVLVGNKISVSQSTVLPPKGFDTTVGNCNNVYVKYYDDEFYPAYVAYYRL